mgnify:CR=1 FL=1|jgi:hypothetical protein|nr:MAG TPA_asm: hypothetical protein [Caudoviricetes sp.]
MAFSLVSVNSGFLMSLKKSKAPARFRVRCFVHSDAVMNLKQLTYKLQAALNQRGEHYKVNQLQHYSERLGRMVTKYVLEKAETDETGKHISTRVLETYSMADVVKTLAKIYSG